MSLRLDIQKFLRGQAAPISASDIARGMDVNTRVLDVELRRLVLDREVEKHHAPTGHTYSVESLLPRRAAPAPTPTPTPTASDDSERPSERLLAPAPTLSDRVHAALRRLGRPVTPKELQEECLPDVSPKRVSAILNYLRTKRCVVPEGVRGTYRWRVTRDGEQAPTRAPTSSPTTTTAKQPSAPIDSDTAVALVLAANVTRVDQVADPSPENAPVPPRFGYCLADHVAAAETDVDELLVDAIEARADHRVLRHLHNARAELLAAHRIAQASAQ